MSKGLHSSAGIAARMESLTGREKQVMELVLVGRLNKVIAVELAQLLAACGAER